jgi:hypothetical protein
MSVMWPPDHAYTIHIQVHSQFILFLSFFLLLLRLLLDATSNLGLLHYSLETHPTGILGRSGHKKASKMCTITRLGLSSDGVYPACGLITPHFHCMHDNSVGIATRLRAGRSGFKGSIPGGGWEFFSSPPRPEWFWSPPSLLYNGYQGRFPCW